MKQAFLTLKKRVNRGTILFGWTTTIFALIAFYTVLTILIYGFAADIIGEQILSINSGIAGQISNRLDNELAETRAIGIEVANTPYFTTITAAPVGQAPEYAWAYRDLVEYVRVTESTHSYVDGIFILFPDDTVIVDAEGLADLDQSELAPETLQRTIAFATNAVTRPEWDRFSWISTGFGQLNYVQLLGDTHHAILVITFDAAYVMRSLQEIPTKYGGEQYILGPEGTIVFSSGGSSTVAVTSVTSGSAWNLASAPRSDIIPRVGAIAGIRSGITELTYWSFIPEPLYLSELQRLQRLFLLAGAVVATIFLVLTVYFLVVHYAPLREIIGTLETASAGASNQANEYQRILEYSNGLLSERKINEAQLRRFEKSLDNRFLERFLKGRISYEELPEHLRNNIGPGQSTVRLVLTKIAGNGSLLELFPLYLSEILPSFPASQHVLAHVYIEDLLAIILEAKETKTDDVIELQQYLDKKNLSFLRETEYTLFTVIGYPFSLDSIRNQYTLCRRKVEEAEFFRHTHALVLDAEEDDQFLYLERHDAEELAGAVRDGDYDHAARVVADMIARIDSLETVGIYAARTLVFSLLTTVIQTVSSSPVPTEEYLSTCRPLIAAFFLGEDIRSMQESLLKVIALSCTETLRRRSDHVRRIVTRIDAYTEENLSDPEMYLPSIAAHFGLNPKYLSSFYKEHQGIALAEAIRRKRIERSCALLRGETPVARIAEMTGFANVVSFNRAFKRITGMTPTEYRRDVGTDGCGTG